ncbi:MAG: type II toxin-antitoxin system VapC family toxin [Gemmatimonadales bacterium]|jgi:predicted nucleic acid-binding protein|nr:MAG: type II toxin-antitoxin system VapC family toxin [Gemmatimonadales bacterium]
MDLVLDASVALAWCFEDEGGGYPVAVLEALQEKQALVSPVWPYEVTNGLIAAEQRHRMKVSESQEAGELLLSLPITVDAIPVHRVFDTVRRLARTHGVSTYDAASLELAIRHGLPLATLHLPLRKAVRAEGLEVFGGPALRGH